MSTEEEFWLVPDAPEVSSTLEKVASLGNDGFIMKPEIVNAEGNRTGLTDIVYYEVEKGDTISSIAQKFGVTRRTISESNEMGNSNYLKTGQILKVIAVNGLVHTVKKGESVKKIAAKYSVKEEDIIAQNKLEASEELSEGADLIVPGAKMPEPPPRIVVTQPKYPTGIPGDPSSEVAANGKLIWPTAGTITQKFHSGHYGYDIANRSGGNIYAAADGVVEKAAYGWNGGYGNEVIIDHGNGMKTLYGHNRELYVSVGQTVSQGQVISAMGNTGRVYGVTGTHCHFEVIINGVKRDPGIYLN
ncbi:M23 family metallopeptidase [Candidatus Peregrinibacteria bacterium]|nr:M23 family metallopeptidase [Candidatus Peregrinibacteria bacterium]